MTTGKAKKIADRMLNVPSLARARKFRILGLNRENPGFGDDAVLADRETGQRRTFLGEFRQGTRVSKNKDYLAACEEYRENGWAGEEGEDEWDPEDDPYRELDQDEIDDGAHISTVIVPESTKFMAPGTELQISYGCGGSSRESAEEWKSDSYHIYGIETLLLALGCPGEDTHVLAGCFWRNSLIYCVMDYDPADHAVWMDRGHRAGRLQPQS